MYKGKTKIVNFYIYLDNLSTRPNFWLDNFIWLVVSV